MLSQQKRMNLKFSVDNETLDILFFAYFLLGFFFVLMKDVKI